MKANVWCKSMLRKQVLKRMICARHRTLNGLNNSNKVVNSFHILTRTLRSSSKTLAFQAAMPTKLSTLVLAATLNISLLHLKKALKLGVSMVCKLIASWLFLSKKSSKPVFLPVLTIKEIIWQFMEVSSNLRSTILMKATKNLNLSKKLILNNNWLITETKDLNMMYFLILSPKSDSLVRVRNFISLTKSIRNTISLILIAQTKFLTCVKLRNLRTSLSLKRVLLSRKCKLLYVGNINHSLQWETSLLSLTSFLVRRERSSSTWQCWTEMTWLISISNFSMWTTVNLSER